MARRGRCAPARSTAKSPTAFAANGAPRSTPISDPSSKPHGEDRSEPSTPSASPSRAAPCLARLENVNGDLSNYSLHFPLQVVGFVDIHGANERLGAPPKPAVSIGSGVMDYEQSRLQDDFQIEPRGPIVDVFDVASQALPKL